MEFNHLPCKPIKRRLIFVVFHLLITLSVWLHFSSLEDTQSLIFSNWRVFDCIITHGIDFHGSSFALNFILAHMLPKPPPLSFCFQGKIFSDVKQFQGIKFLFVCVVQGFLNYLHIVPSRKKPLPILHDISGIIKPSRWKIHHQICPLLAYSKSIPFLT